MAYSPTQAYLDAVNTTARGILSPADLDSAFQDGACRKLFPTSVRAV